MRRLVCGLAAAVLAGSVAHAADGVNANVTEDLDRSLAGGGRADVVVEFGTRADLSPAFRMSWNARGDYVVNALREAADQSQAPAIAWLKQSKLRYRSFLVGNLLYVHGATLAVANALASLPNVTRVRAPITIELPTPTVNDLPAPNSAPTWDLNDTHAPEFWSTFGTKGAGVVVASIDTGVQYDHPALKAQFNCASPTDAKCWFDPSNVCGAAGVCDNNGHGTHTMGTMVAADNASLPYIAGMAPGAKWIACKGCESSSCSEAALNSCADWVLSPGGSTLSRPNVVNNSWGGSGNSTWYEAKVQAWKAAGIFPAFSAGNSGSTCKTLGSPGDYQESFASAAHDSSRTIAYFSSRGPSAFGSSPYTKPNISAPGVGVISSVPTNSWASYDGTSMASPHTAGAVALLWSCNPALKGQIDQTIQILQASADPAPAGNCGAPASGQGNYTYGYGYLDVLAAGEQACGGAVNTMHVSGLAPYALCGRQLVTAAALIVDAGDQPLAQSQVTGTWTFPDGSTKTVTKTALASGRAWATVFAPTTLPGSYQFCVDGVTNSGFTYNPADNATTCETVNYACN